MQIFVAMPIGKEIPGIRREIRKAVRNAGFDCKFPDETEHGKISKHIVDQIRLSSAVIVEISDRNPNVIWEYGYASAVGKTIIPITQSDASFFFDGKDDRAIIYDVNELERTLTLPLTIWLEKLYKSDGKFPPVHLVGTPNFELASLVMSVNSISVSKFGIFDLIKIAKNRVLMAAQNHRFVANSIPEFKEALLVFFREGAFKRFDILMCDPSKKYSVETWKFVTSSEYEDHLIDASDKFKKLEDWAASQDSIGHRLRVRRVPLVPVSINFIDPDEPDGFLVMTPNLLESRSRSRPSFVISRMNNDAIFQNYWATYGYLLDL